MGLKILRDPNGNPRPTWYGRISVKGSKRETNLGVPIEGTIPTDANGNFRLTGKGDAAFEKSRNAAQKAFKRWRRETQKDPAELQSKAYKARTGESLDGLPFAQLYKKWRALKRGYELTTTWCTAVKKWFKDFASFARAYAARHGERCETLNDVTTELAGAWFDEIKGTHSWETVKKMMGLMRNAYSRHQTSGRPNPFKDVMMRNRETGNARVNHKPLTTEETERLFACSRGDAEFYPLIVAAACTGMRIGDVCNLKWSDVDMSNGLIDCVTAKAGRPVSIPIFERLFQVLREREPVPGDGTPPSPFVFPSAEKKYRTDPTAIYKNVKPYFALAVYGDKAEERTVTTAENTTGETPLSSQAEVEKAIAASGFSEKKRIRILEVYRRFKAGEPSSKIAAALNVARSQVSMDLRDLEQLTGEELRPMAKAMRDRKTRLDLIDCTRAKRSVGRHKASLYGWHSLRATFVVLAIEAGVPLAEVQKVVGHSTAEMTLQYFYPDRKHAAERLKRKMRGSVLDRPGRQSRPTGNISGRTVPVPKNDIDKILAALATLPQEERTEIVRRLQGS